MNNPFDYDDDSTSTVFRDIIFLALFGFMAIVLLIIAHINPPAKNDNRDIPPPGNMLVEMSWDDDYNLDIDLWVQAPNDKIVGYSSKSGKLFNLLRDDLGFTNDETDKNYEIALTRGLKPGEYTVNVMFYANRHFGSAAEKKKFKILEFPIKVKIVVSVKKDDNSSLVKVIETTVELWTVKEEVTATNFKLDKNNNVIRDSINNIYKGLASAAAGVDTGDTQ